jgi:hypothetical protein
MEVQDLILSVEKIMVQVSKYTKILKLKLINSYWNIIGLADGGNGGKGGDVYFRSTARLSSLYDLRRAHF